MNPPPSVTESMIHKKSLNFIHLRLLFCKIVYRLYFCPDLTGLKEVVEF